MTRGIRLKQLTANDLGYLGLPADGLPDASTPQPATTSSADSDHNEAAAPGLPAPLEITRDVRLMLEETLRLLDAREPSPSD